MLTKQSRKAYCTYETNCLNILELKNNFNNICVRKIQIWFNRVTLVRIAKFISI